MRKFLWGHITNKVSNTHIRMASYIDRVLNDLLGRERTEQNSNESIKQQLESQYLQQQRVYSLLQQTYPQTVSRENCSDYVHKQQCSSTQTQCQWTSQRCRVTTQWAKQLCDELLRYGSPVQGAQVTESDIAQSFKLLYPRGLPPFGRIKQLLPIPEQLLSEGKPAELWAYIQQQTLPDISIRTVTGYITDVLLLCRETNPTLAARCQWVDGILQHQDERFWHADVGSQLAVLLLTCLVCLRNHTSIQDDTLDILYREMLLPVRAWGKFYALHYLQHDTKDLEKAVPVVFRRKTLLPWLLPLFLLAMVPLGASAQPAPGFQGFKHTGAAGSIKADTDNAAALQTLRKGEYSIQDQAALAAIFTRNEIQSRDFSRLTKQPDALRAATTVSFGLDVVSDKFAHTLAGKQLFEAAKQEIGRNKYELIAEMSSGSSPMIYDTVAAAVKGLVTGGTGSGRKAKHSQIHQRIAQNAVLALVHTNPKYTLLNILSDNRIVSEMKDQITTLIKGVEAYFKKAPRTKDTENMLKWINLVTQKVQRRERDYFATPHQADIDAEKSLVIQHAQKQVLTMFEQAGVHGFAVDHAWIQHTLPNTKQDFDTIAVTLGANTSVDSQCQFIGLSLQSNEIEPTYVFDACMTLQLQDVFTDSTVDHVWGDKASATSRVKKLRTKLLDLLYDTNHKTQRAQLEKYVNTNEWVQQMLKLHDKILQESRSWLNRSVRFGAGLIWEGAQGLVSWIQTTLNYFHWPLAVLKGRLYEGIIAEMPELATWTLKTLAAILTACASAIGAYFKWFKPATPGPSTPQGSPVASPPAYTPANEGFVLPELLMPQSGIRPFNPDSIVVRKHEFARKDVDYWAPGKPKLWKLLRYTEHGDAVLNLLTEKKGDLSRSKGAMDEVSSEELARKYQMANI